MRTTRSDCARTLAIVATKRLHRIEDQHGVRKVAAAEGEHAGEIPAKRSRQLSQKAEKRRFFR